MGLRNKKLVAVVIPIYKRVLSENEKSALLQAFKVFNRYQIVFACPESLDLTFYQNYSSNRERVVFERFPDNYFENIQGYNALLLSKTFYWRFRKFQYILIYQLDGFVFRDELELWCEKEYDYIGAPWFQGYSHRHTNHRLFAVGNGGVSLRRVDSFLRLLNSKKALKSFVQLWNDFYSTENTFFQNLIILFKVGIKGFGYKNNIKYFLKNFNENEDQFWGIYSKVNFPNFKVCPVDDAINFSFECDPEYLYKINDKRLPFCCHAWEKYDIDFWRPFIEEEGYKIK